MAKMLSNPGWLFAGAGAGAGAVVLVMYSGNCALVGITGAGVGAVTLVGTDDTITSISLSVELIDVRCPFSSTV